MTYKKFLFAKFVAVMFIVAFYSQIQAKEQRWYKNIQPHESAQLIQINSDNPKFVILDVRTLGEVSRGKIENSIQLDFYSHTFAADLLKLDKQKTYLVYCRSGNRSSKTLEIMRKMKFERVYNMLGGIRSWNAQGLPVS